MAISDFSGEKNEEDASSNNPDLLTCQGPVHIGISEDVAEHPLAGQPCPKSTGFTL